MVKAEQATKLLFVETSELVGSTSSKEGHNRALVGGTLQLKLRLPLERLNLTL